MKLRRIKIRNFRGAQDVELGGLSGLNILVGRNNSGKSTVLSAVGGFFEHFREGGIVRLPRVGEAPQGAVGPGSFMRDIDYFAKDLSHPIEIEARFALADPEIDALLGNIVAEAPQLENAARAAVVAGSTLLVRLQSNPPPAPFTFVQQLSIEGSDGAQGISLLQIPASDAVAIAGSLSRVRDLRSYANSVQTTASRMDSSEFERAKRERGMSYYVAGLDPAARRAITEQILRADTYDQFIEGLREAATVAEHRAMEAGAEPLAVQVGTFSGSQPMIPNYATALAQRIGETRVLQLGERRSAIGNQEAQRILNLKIERGGQDTLRAIQATVDGLLGVSFDAYRAPNAQRGPREAQAELDVDEFLVELNGSGIREALRMILDVEFEKPDVILIEEPEVHLHPALEYRIRQYLHTLSGSRQIFATTHSTSFLDDAAGLSSYLVTKSGGASIVNKVSVTEDASEVLAELGVRPSALFLFAHLVFVEGRSDEAVIREWCRTLDLDLEEKNVGFVHTTGSGNFRYFAHAESLNLLTEKGIRVTFIRDRDEMTSDEVQAFVDRAPAKCDVVVLGRREIENYLLRTHAIAEALQEASDTEIDPKQVDDAIRDGLASACERTVLLNARHRLLTPIYAPHSDDLPTTGDVNGWLTVALDEMSKEIGTRKALVEEALQAARADVDEQWERSAESLAPGAEILQGVFGQFGLKFNKMRDDRAIAQRMSPNEVPSEISSWAEGIRGGRGGLHA